ncbi:MAG: endonuclease/exonuclease/phosphatase family protein [Planctomycetaceae bacterium]
MRGCSVWFPCRLVRCSLFVLFAGLLSVVSAVPTADAQDLRVMSFNVRYGTASDGPDSWPQRQELVAGVIRNFAPDLLGTQEMLPFQAEYLREELGAGADRPRRYAYIGWSRDASAGGEQCGLFICEDRFQVEGAGQFWLSERPEEKFSKSWDSSLPRVCTWARLQDRQVPGRRLLFANTHFDHRGAEARLQSARLLRDRLPQLAGGLPIVLTGDFNCGEQSLPWSAAAADGVLVDSFRAAFPERQASEGTFHGFRGTAGAERIDWILYSAGRFQTVAATIDRTERGGRYPSDHFPVTAVLRYTAAVAQ